MSMKSFFQKNTKASKRKGSANRTASKNSFFEPRYMDGSYYNSGLRSSSDWSLLVM